MPETSPPTSIYAGDSWAWTATLASYDPATYRARVVFSRAGHDPVSIESPTSSGDSYSFTLTPAVSQSMPPGEWLWAYRVTARDGTASLIADTGCTTLKPDPAAETRTSSHNERCLSLVKAALEDRLTDVQESFSVLGQDITKVSADQLLKLKNHYTALVNRERQREHRHRGGSRVRHAKFILKD